MICEDTPTYGWVYGCVDGWVILLTFDFLLKPPQPITGLFFSGWGLGVVGNITSLMLKTETDRLWRRLVKNGT